MPIQKITVATATTLDDMRSSVELAINRLVQQVNQNQEQDPWNAYNQRIQNVGWPSQWHDAVNVEYLQSVLPKKKKILSTSTAGAASTLPEFITASIDVTDTQLHATLQSTIDATTDPVTATFNIADNSRRSFHFGSNSFYAIPSSDNSVAEILKCTALTSTSGTSTATLARAQFGTIKATHNVGDIVYFTDIQRFVAETPVGDAASAAEKNYKILLPNQCVMSILTSGLASFSLSHIESGFLNVTNAVSNSGGGFGTNTLFTTLVPRNQPYYPGLFIDNGTQYTMKLQGTLTAGQTMDQWYPVRTWTGIKNCFARVKDAPTGSANFSDPIFGSNPNASLVVYLLYIEPPLVAGNSQRRVAIASRMDFQANKFVSYDPSDSPDGRNGPYNGKFPFVLLDVVGIYQDIFDATGAVLASALPLVPNGQTLYMAADGDFTPMVAQIGPTLAGADLSVAFQA